MFICVKKGETILSLLKSNMAYPGLEIATNMVANASNFFSLATKIVV